MPRPKYEVYVVAQGKTKARWTKVGTVWESKSGKMLNMYLDAVPINGKAFLRVPGEKKEEEKEEGV